MAVLSLACIGSANAAEPVADRTAVGTTSRVNISSDGRQANFGGQDPALSANGRYVAFVSSATNLVEGDTNRAADIFVRDRLLRTTVRVSEDSRGHQADASSSSPSISSSGRYVAFLSDAADLVPHDTVGSDAFVKDLKTGRTRRVSLGVNGQQNGHTGAVAISGNGRFVAFTSDGDNLVAGDTNGTDDAFIRNLATGVTRRVSVDSGGLEANGQTLFEVSISNRGRYVAFPSDATNLVQHDTNGVSDIFVRDRATRTTQRVSVGPRGAEANEFSFGAQVAAKGRIVTFTGCASNLVRHDTNERCDVFTRNLRTQVTRRVSVTNSGAEAIHGASFEPSISANGRFVAFGSNATNLVSDDTNGVADAFLRDRWAQTTVRVSLGPDGRQGNNHVTAFGTAISAGGNHVAFDSAASNLVARDTNDIWDVFVWDRSRHAAPQRHEPS